jgi:exopolyphosphatase/guanosine-5'-triphosphate,3'-diphosphate pyrophosphatase
VLGGYGVDVRAAVLDVGSNSAHLQIVDLRPGEPPRALGDEKYPTRLAGAIRGDGALGRVAVDRLVSAIGDAAGAVRAERVDELIAFATSVVRDAANHEQITARVAAETGVRLGFLSGRDEARLTFLAARAWYGWSAGSILLLDIGGGSVEIASGEAQEPAVALSLPLGARRLTLQYLPGDPPAREHVRRLRRHVRDRLAQTTGALLEGRVPVRAVATSKTFAQLARLTGAAKTMAGPYVRRSLRRDLLRDQLGVLQRLDTEQRAELPGISQGRAHQVLAGAIVAEAIMSVFDLDDVDICPWALREGVMLRRLQGMGTSAVPDDIGHLIQHLSVGHRAGAPPHGLAGSGRGGTRIDRSPRSS